jgi:hypothetical protein
MLVIACALTEGSAGSWRLDSWAGHLSWCCCLQLMLLQATHPLQVVSMIWQGGKGCLLISFQAGLVDEVAASGFFRAVGASVDGHCKLSAFCFVWAMVFAVGVAVGCVGRSSYSICIVDVACGGCCCWHVLDVPNEGRRLGLCWGGTVPGSLWFVGRLFVCAWLHAWQCLCV